eukprot:7335486-Alexandrium_andersonii.AAC.1
MLNRSTCLPECFASVLHDDGQARERGMKHVRDLWTATEQFKASVAPPTRPTSPARSSPRSSLGLVLLRAGLRRLALCAWPAL